MADDDPDRLSQLPDDDSSCVRYKDDASWSWLPDDQVGEFDFSFGSVASAALRLRVLHITNCRDLTPPPPASTFPCLEVLRLRKCSANLETIQDMVVASPQLAVLQLEYVFLTTETETPSSPLAGAQWQAQENEWQWPGYYNGNYGYYDMFSDDYSGRRWHLPQSLCCPGITTLVLLNCDCEWGKHIAVELDVPRVQHFRYRGRIDKFRLRSPLLDVRRVYLHFLDSLNCQVFSKFLKNFGDAKVLKLKLECKIDYVTEPDRETFTELLGETTFNVEHLEIDARHNPTRKDAAVAIGNLLQCCPVILDLRVKLNTADQLMRSTFLKNKAHLEFYKSVDHFRRRRDQVIPMFAEDDKAEVVSDVPGFSDRWFHFNCLRFHLRRLSLQFQMDKPDCVGIQLARFFVERAMALEEMYIDDGNMRLWEHMNCKAS